MKEYNILVEEEKRKGGQTMKHLDKIKKGLECCLYFDKCDECPYVEDIGCNAVQMTKDTLACIQQLEAKDAEKDQRIAELEKELTAVKRERDAAVADLELCGLCKVCKHFETKCNDCRRCKLRVAFCDKFEWRGVCPDTEVQNNE